MPTDPNGAMRLQTPSRIVAAFLNLANKPHHVPLVAAKTQWKIAQPFRGPTASRPRMSRSCCTCCTTPWGRSTSAPSPRRS